MHKQDNILLGQEVVIIKIIHSRIYYQTMYRTLHHTVVKGSSTTYLSRKFNDDFVAFMQEYLGFLHISNYLTNLHMTIYNG